MIPSDGSEGGAPAKPTWVCEFCFRLAFTAKMPPTWDLIWQSAVCPDCQARVKLDGGYNVVRGGAYATDGAIDPRAQKADPPLAAAPSLEVERARLADENARLSARNEELENLVALLREVSPSASLGTSDERVRRLLLVAADCVAHQGVQADAHGSEAAQYEADADTLRALAPRLPALEASELDTKRMDWLEARGVRNVYFADESQLNPASMSLRFAIDANTTMYPLGRSSGEDTING